VTWVRLDDEFPAHPKLAEVGPLGLAMQVAALCYCNRYLTDGFIPRGAAATLLDFNGIGLVNGMQGIDADWKLIADRMVEIGLWDETQSRLRDPRLPRLPAVARSRFGGTREEESSRSSRRSSICSSTS
jgi:hypothetical protein